MHFVGFGLPARSWILVMAVLSISAMTLVANKSSKSMQIQAQRRSAMSKTAKRQNASICDAEARSQTELDRPVFAKAQHLWHSECIFVDMK